MQTVGRQFPQLDLNKYYNYTWLCGVRGYYRDTMGKPGVNDRAIYDDAIFIFSPDVFLSFNANTDPSIYRSGHGTAEATKGVAVLDLGVWTFIQGKHRGQYAALRQFGLFRVHRDGKQGSYLDEGTGFGINIHRGGYQGTSSLGCQTIHPDQWEEFIETVYSEMLKHRQSTIQYVLISGPVA